MTAGKICVFCGIADNLNTEMGVTIEDGSRVQVWVCDTHAEEATVKSVREAYNNRLQKLQELIESAKALGFNLNAISQTQQPATAPTAIVRQEAKPKPKEPAPLELDDPENVVDTSKLDNARAFISQGGQTEFGSVQSFSNYSLEGGQDKLDPSLRQGKAHLTLAEGRDGKPIVIPDKRVDGTGTTTIKIVKNTNDDVLQRRFKQMATESMSDRPPDFAHNGYSSTTRECPLCHGQGTIINNKKIVECPKCHASGILSNY